MTCNACDGTPGRYPIIDKFGTQLFEIECPACGGSGHTDKEWSDHLDAVSDRLRYEDAMRDSSHG